jgi:DNA-binding NtrC family response regulator
MLIRLALALSDINLQNYLKRKLATTDVRVEALGGRPSIWEKVMRCACDVIVFNDKLLAGKAEDIAMINELPENPTTIVIMSEDEAEAHAQLTAAGADVVLYRSIAKDSMFEAIEAALESRRQFIQHRRFDRRGSTDPKISDFVSESRSMQLFMEEVIQVIPSDTPILLLGETGVGKEHLAKAIHTQSPRSIGPFISVNMAAMSEQLLESELFGHEQGAFTGAIRYRRGAFELAHGGTIFMDEIGELSLHLQTKLLSVLQNYEVRPVGSETAIDLDVRVIAATNQDLEKQVADGSFRQDLYYRLSVLMLTIPPLRHRREDIPAMVRRFIAYFRYKIGRTISGIHEEALQALCKYDWPGNVRELMNVIERAILLCKGDEIGMPELPNGLHGNASANGYHFIGTHFKWEELNNLTLPEVQVIVMEEVERRYLTAALQKTKGKINLTAQIAGIHPRGLYNKMKRYGLRKEAFK